MLVLITLAIIALNAPQPPPHYSGRIVPIPVAIVASYIIALALFLNSLGVLFAMIGGWLGGFIGRRWVTKPAQYD